ncbi:MAG: ribonuclease J [Candidatus Pacebacteria bacterium]|nr:ribonuclease J [Candidatus Paceibacterota bacterium]
MNPNETPNKNTPNSATAGPRPSRRYHARPQRPSPSSPAHHSPSHSSPAHSSAHKPKERMMPRRGFSAGGRGGHGTGPAGEKKENLPIPPLAPGNIRIIPLGGVEEIGMNMTVLEMGDDIIVMDAGFKFTDSDTPGIDYILPNTKYLEERKHKVRGMIITHGHLDHIGALPFIMERIGNPPLYTRNLTSLMLKKRQAEFPHLQPIDYKIVEGNDQIKMGNISVQFFGVTHSIPDSMGIIIKTPNGWIVNPGDFKLNHTDGVVDAEEEKSYSVFNNQKVLLYLGESTNIENPGFSTPEKLVHENLEEIIRTIKGRLIMAMFASHVYRIAHIVRVCEKFGKKLVIEGRSMKNNIDIVITAGLLKVDKKTIINPQDIDQYPPDKVVVLATGAQGEEFSFLTRLANNNYKHFKLNERDTVLLSSSIIPGNERQVQHLKDSIARQGAHIMHYRTSDVYIHSTGHGNRGEMEWLHRKLRPKFFIPIHGHHYMLRLHGELAEQLGIPKSNIIIPDDGTIIEIQADGEKIVRLPAKAPHNVVMVDGFTVGDIQDVVIRDRQILSQDGIFVIIALVNASTGKLKKSPDIISRGSVYLRESQELLRHARFLIKKTIEDNTAMSIGASGNGQVNFDYVKDAVSDAISKYLFQETAKRPIVIPVLLAI